MGTRKTSSTYRRLAVGLAAVVIALVLPTAAFAAPVRLMIDPGHGGSDPGAVGGKLQEKNSNLEISKDVARDARRQGWSVGMTRTNDAFVGLVERPMMATRAGSDVFVSIHSNSTGNHNMGSMTIYRTAQGKRLGQAIMNELAPITPYTDIGNKQDVRGLAVLRASKKTAVLVEVLSVTPRHERAQLQDPAVQKEVAQAIVRGIAKFERVKYKEPAGAEDKSQDAQAQDSQVGDKGSNDGSVTQATNQGDQPDANKTPQADGPKNVTQPWANSGDSTPTLFPSILSSALE